MKKFITIILCIVLVLVAFAGCKGDKEQTSQPTEVTKNEGTTQGVVEEKPVEIAGDISIWGGGHLTSVAEVVLEDYLAQHTDLNITYEKYPFAEYPTKMKLQLSADESTPDIMIIHDFLGQQFIKAGWLQDISGLVDTSDLVQNYQYNIMDGDALYGLPYQGSVMTFTYRQDIFDGLGLEVPTNKEEYLAVGAALKEAGYYIDAYNPAVMSKNTFIRFLPMLGGQIYDNEGNFVLDTPEGKGLETIEFLEEMRDLGYFHESKPQSDEFWTAINSGEIAATLQASFFGPYFETGLDPDGKGGFGNWVMANPPKLADDGRNQYQLAATYVVINARSENAEVALEIAKYLTMSEEGAAVLANVNREGIMAKILNNYIPGLEMLAKDSEPWEPFGDQKVASWIAEAILGTEIELPYKDTRYAQAENFVDLYVSSYFLNGDKTAEETIAKIAEEASKLVEQK